MLIVGLMSGTSLDGVDAVLASFDTSGTPSQRGHVHRPFDAKLRADLMALQSPTPGELHRAALAANGVSLAYADAVLQLLQQCHVPAVTVRCLGAHGQTVRHQPGLHDGTGYSLQLLNASLLAERTGIDVAYDFRSRDVAAGGQGAPLVPAFHAAMFAPPTLQPSNTADAAHAKADARFAAPQTRAVLNVGGMANATILHADSTVTGFDTGPGGALLDAWCARHRGVAFDDEGQWAASGRVDEALLRALLRHPYFAQAAPKSTGRDTFHLTWVEGCIAATRRLASSPTLAAVDVQATLSELTARTAAESLLQAAPGIASLVVCGGGARNSDLLSRLQDHLPKVSISDSAGHGIPVDQVEALAFAWLAWRLVHRREGNVPAVTGARGPRVLGSIAPGA